MNFESWDFSRPEDIVAFLHRLAENGYYAEEQGLIDEQEELAKKLLEIFEKYVHWDETNLWDMTFKKALKDPSDKGNR